jgi:ATP phosphoribosyltransferase
MSQRNDIRLALPSKGRLSEDAQELLANAGLRVYKPNPRQYQASIPSLPNLTVLFQRAGDIAVSVHDGTVDFGITGWDVIAEKSANGEVLPLHKKLGFGHCTLNVIVPESWKQTRCVADLQTLQRELERPLRVATKFPNVTRKFFDQRDLKDIHLISAEGTLEIAPTIGYTDLIVDLVSSGTTLRDNRLRVLEDGQILASQACLVANRAALQTRPEVLVVARQMLEFVVAHLRATENVAIFANMRGASPQSIAEKIFAQKTIGGLEGPTISPVVTRDGGDWYAANIIVRKDQLAQSISELRAIGGSGVIVMPVTYIFEEEPQAYKDMLAALEMK